MENKKAALYVADLLNHKYKNDKTFRSIYDALHGNLPECSIEHHWITELLSLLISQNGFLFYENKLCVLHISTKGFYVGHDCEISRHTSSSKRVCCLNHFVKNTKQKMSTNTVLILISGIALRMVKAGLLVILSFCSFWRTLRKRFYGSDQFTAG